MCPDEAEFAVLLRLRPGEESDWENCAHFRCRLHHFIFVGATMRGDVRMIPMIEYDEQLRARRALAYFERKTVALRALADITEGVRKDRAKTDRLIAELDAAAEERALARKL